jgi:predicted nuclease of predicted toxin-antitoxin system
MKLNSLPLLVDENIHPQVIDTLRKQNRSVLSVLEVGLQGESDVTILRRACVEGQVVLTHDRDFGQLAIPQCEPYLGIIYVRPGHIRPDFVLTILQAIEAQDMEVEMPFLLVAERRGDTVRIRLRQGNIDEHTKNANH